MRWLALPLMLFGGVVQAEAPDIVAVTVDRASGRFDVTLAHPDTGWSHYADAWRVETLDGAVLGERILAHPHETEQPFTRSLAGVPLQGHAQVIVRARCLRDGWSADGVKIAVPD